MTNKNLNIIQVKPASVLNQIFDSNTTLLIKPQWTGIHGEGMLYFEIKEDTDPVAYFNVYRYRRFGKSFVITPPAFPYCGLSFTGSLDKEGLLNVLNAITEYFQQEFKKSYIEVCLAPDLYLSEYSAPRGFKFEELKNYKLDLTLSEEVLTKQLSENRRRSIKKATKGYQIEIDSNHTSVFKMIDFVLKRIDKQEMRNVYEHLLSNPQNFSVRTVLVSKDESPLASGFFIYDKSECFYLAGGQNANASDNHAGTICLWTAILEAKKSGNATFNFCGSSIPSIERYFKSFGSVAYPYFRLKSGTELIDMVKQFKKKYLRQ